MYDVAGADRGGGLNVERLHCVGSSVAVFCGHPLRTVVVDRGGGLVVCSGGGAVELSCGTSGQGVQCACWSHCGDFIFLGGSQGRISLLHVPSVTEVMLERVFGAGGSLVDDSTDGFREMCLVGGASSDIPSMLLVLLASGTLLRFIGLRMTMLIVALEQASSSAAGAIPEDLRRAMEGLWQDGSRLVTHKLPRETQSFRVCGRILYSVNVSGLCVHSFDGDVLRLEEVVALPEFDYHCVGHPMSESPSKRQRSSGGSNSSLTSADLEFACLAVWPNCTPGVDESDSCPAGRDFDADAFSFGAECAKLVAVAFRRPGCIVSYDAATLVELNRWIPPCADGGAVQILAASQVRISRHPMRMATDDNLSSAPTEEPFACETGICVALEDGRLLLVAVPLGQVVFSSRLVEYEPSSCVLMVAPMPLTAETLASDTVVAFVSITPQFADGCEGEAILSAVQYSPPEGDAEDSTIQFPFMGDAGLMGSVAEPSTAGLRHQLEVCLERAQQGQLLLESANFLRLAAPLMMRIPGYVVGSILTARFVDLVQAREALTGVAQWLQDDSVPANYDVIKGRSLLTDTMIRISTFEHLRWMLTHSSTDADVEGSRYEEPSVAKRLSGYYLTPGRSGTANEPIDAVEPRRHSVACIPRGFDAREDEALSGALALLMGLHGDDWAAWQKFRCASLPQMCQDLAREKHLGALFMILARHGSNLHPSGVMAAMEALPGELAEKEEDRLPHWLVSHVLPLLHSRQHFVRWLTGRAELLEAMNAAPEAALHLLGTVLISTLPLHDQVPLGKQACSTPSEASPLCSGAQSFPHSRTARCSFWAGCAGGQDLVRAWLQSKPPAWKVPVASGVLRSDGRPSDVECNVVDGDGAEEVAELVVPSDGTDRMLEVFQYLLYCQHLHRVHGLRVSLQDFQEQNSARSAAAVVASPSGQGRWVITRLLDRVMAPELLLEEVRTHVAGVCDWQHASEGAPSQQISCAMDAALQDYVLDLAESLCLAGSEVRLERAAVVAQCIKSVERRAHCTVELLRHWSGSEVPSQLGTLIAEASAWRQADREHLEHLAALADIRRIPMRYGFHGACVTHWLNSGRFAEHLVSRVDSGVKSLRDAQAILRVYPLRHLTGAEALYFRLTHIAAAAEDAAGDGSVEVTVAQLCKEALLAISCAASEAEARAAARCFASYCCDLLGDWAAAIASCGDGADAPHDASAQPQDISAWKVASKAICGLVVSVLRQAGGRASSRQLMGCADSSTLEVLLRLRRLHEEFDIFPDPLAISVRSAAAQEEVFMQFAGKSLRRYIDQHRSQNAASASGLSEGTSDYAHFYARLQRVGSLLGLGAIGVERLIMREAATQGVFALCGATLERLMLRDRLEGAAGLVNLVRGLLRHFGTNAQGLRHPKELIQQLAHLEETVTACLCQCDPADIAPLLEISADVRVALEVLMNSDLPDALAKGSSGVAQAKFECLPVQHARRVGELMYGGGGSVMVVGSSCSIDVPVACGIDEFAASGAGAKLCFFRDSYRELPLLLPGATAARAALDYMDAKNPSPELFTGTGTCDEGDLDGGDARSALANGTYAGCSRFSDKTTVLPRLLDLLRSSECVELATSLILRHPRQLSGADLQRLCQERVVRVLRAGGGHGLDQQLAATYAGGLDVQMLAAAFASAAASAPGNSAGAFESSEIGHVRKLATLGADIAVLCGDVGLMAEMLRRVKHTRGPWCLSLLGAANAQLSAGSPLLVGGTTGAAGAAGAPGGGAEAAARAAGADLRLAVHAGRVLGAREVDVVAAWVERRCLTLAAERFPVKADGVEGGFEECYQLLVAPAVLGLPRDVAEQVLLERVLPAISPYDYARIAFVLGLCGDHAATLQRRCAADVLASYARCSPLSARESRREEAALRTWLADYQRQQPGANLKHVERIIRQWASSRLPWHGLVLGDDPWTTLRPELLHCASLEDTISVFEAALGLRADDLRACFLEQALDACDASVGLSARVPPLQPCDLKSTLLHIRDTKSAQILAKRLEGRLELGLGKIAMAHGRLELALRAQGEADSQASSEEILKLRQHVALLESRWELLLRGLSALDGLLVEQGARSCVACLYYYSPSLLSWDTYQRSGFPGRSAADDGVEELAAAAQRLGVDGIHAVADFLCIRHGLAPRAVRHQLIQQWLLDPRWSPPGGPPAMEEAQARHLVRLARGGNTSLTATIAASGDGHELPAPTMLSARPRQEASVLFTVAPVEALCEERVVLVARPRHLGAVRGVAKDAREDVRTRCVFILKLVFAKEASHVPYCAKCRALAVLFRIASQEQVARAYNHPAETLQEIWMLYFYMDAFERLGVPQDFKRFYTCSKEGLARSLWRSHQADDRVLQVVTALCLDFRVCDTSFWVAILSRLRSLRADHFLLCTLVALHERLAHELPRDPAFATLLRELLRGPVDVLAAWLHGCEGRSGSRARSPGGLEGEAEAPGGSRQLPPFLAWLLALPTLLARSPLVDALGVRELAHGILAAATRAPRLDLMRLVAGLRKCGGGERNHGISAEEPDRIFLATLALDVALCGVSDSHCAAFFCEEAAACEPWLVAGLLERCSVAAVRRELCAGLLRQLASAGLPVWRSLSSALKGELEEQAVASQDIGGFLEAALADKCFNSAERLLTSFAQTHGLGGVGGLIAAASAAAPRVCFGGEDASGARGHVLGVLRSLAGKFGDLAGDDSDARARAFQEFAAYVLRV